MIKDHNRPWTFLPQSLTESLFPNSPPSIGTLSWYGKAGKPSHAPSDTKTKPEESRSDDSSGKGRINFSLTPSKRLSSYPVFPKITSGPPGLSCPVTFPQSELSRHSSQACSLFSKPEPDQFRRSIDHRGQYEQAQCRQEQHSVMGAILYSLR